MDIFPCSKMSKNDIKASSIAITRLSIILLGFSLGWWGGGGGLVIYLSITILPHHMY